MRVSFFLLWKYGAYITANEIFKSNILGYILFITGNTALVYYYEDFINTQRKEMLNNIKTVYSLDYSKLDNITKIDFSEDGNFYVYTNYKASYKLEEKCIPKNQEMLLRLDKMYDRI